MDPSVTQFFDDTPPPANFDKIGEEVAAFMAKNKGKKIAVVTSGGTTVPLEKNTVRYLDNFSGGGRGSRSAENFLRLGYAVLFLAREHSLMPFSRFFTHPTVDLIDRLQLEDGRVEFKIEREDVARQLIIEYKEFTEKGVFKRVLYRTVHEYLYLLKMASQLLEEHAGSNGLLYCAAAVSDFYVPYKEMAEHKIQSSAHGSGLNLKLWPVPKLLGVMKEQWSPSCFVVTFKLETDPAMLRKKMDKSLSSYGQQLVIGNLLANYKDVVVFLGRDESTLEVKRSPEKDFIEPQMIDVVSRYHDEFLESL